MTLVFSLRSVLQALLALISISSKLHFLDSNSPKLYVLTIDFFRSPFVPQVGLVYIRGCEVEGMLDHLGRIIEEGPDPKPKLTGGQRTYRVW